MHSVTNYLIMNLSQKYTDFHNNLFSLIIYSIYINSPICRRLILYIILYAHFIDIKT